jgi:hypothetical protein
MTELWSIELSECNFIGTISSLIGKLTRLSNFRINGNAFTGTLPVASWPERLAFLYNPNEGNFQFQRNEF